MLKIRTRQPTYQPSKSMVHKRQQTAGVKDLGSPSCILSYKKTKCTGGRESNVSLNPSMPCLGNKGMTAWYIDRLI